MDSIKMLVYAFVMSRVDYVFSGSPRYVTDKLQCELNAAARLVTGTHKFDHGLSHLLHDELHWLDVPERIHYKLGLTVHRCLQNKAPECLVDYGTPVSHSQPASFTVSHSTSPDRTMLRAQHFRSLGLLCRWSDGLGTGTRYRTVSVTRARRSAATDSDVAEDESVSSLPLSTHSAVDIHDSALYKSIIDIDIECCSPAECNISVEKRVVV